MSKKMNKKLASQFKILRATQLKAIIAIVIRTLLNLYIVSLLQKIVDLIAKNHGGGYPNELYKTVTTLLLFILFLFISQYFLRLLFFTGNFYLTDFLFKNLIQKSPSYFETSSVGENLSKITSDGYIMSDWLAQGKVMLITQFFILIANLAFLFYFSAIITSIVVLLLIICFYSINQISKHLGKLTKKDQDLKGKIHQKMAQTLLAIQDVKQFSLEHKFANEIESDLFIKRLPISKLLAFYFSLYVGISSFIAMIIPIIALILASLLASKNVLSIGSIVAIYSTSRLLDEPIRVISDQLSNRNLALKTQERLADIYNHSTDSNFLNIINEIPNFEHLKINIKSLKFKDTQTTILNNTNIVIHKNDFIILKGPTGVGKSTIGNLIMNQIKSDSFKGSVRWNDTDIKQYSEKYYYEKANKMNQDTTLFEASIKDNITLFEEYTDKEIEEVLLVVGLSDFIKEKGLSYQLSDGSNNISGGQKQRIAIARILLRKPDFIILDEPTSSLNKDLREEIAKNIKKYTQKHQITALIITHQCDFDDYSPHQIYLSN